MTDEREFFSPEKVDEQVDHLSQSETRRRLPRSAQAARPSQTERRLVRDLRGYYQAAQQEDIVSLERAWKRVSPHLATSGERPQILDKPSSSEVLRISQERNRQMYRQTPERSAEKKARRWPGLLAAILVAAVLVGGLLAVLRASHARGEVGSGQVTTATTRPTVVPTSQPIGTTVYTSPALQGGYSGVAWSPDSKRVALLDHGGSIQIQDATTGAHKVTVALPGQNEWTWAMAWSPTGQEIALGTNQHLLIADSQTGAILHSYTSNVALTGVSSSPYLSDLIPTSGGFGYRALSWSPDGTYLAASLSAGPSGSIQIWKMQTHAVIATLSLGGSYVVGALAWSADSKYLAGQGYSTQTGLDNIVAVWGATSRQIVFQKQVVLDGSDAPIYWQPQSHNLAFMADVNNRLTLEIWNTLTGQKVHQYDDKGNDAMAFSPDGKQLAYAGYMVNGKTSTEAVIIMDVSTGAQVYAYKNSSGPLAWSPNGRYIISTSGGQMISGKNGQPIMKNGRVETTPFYIKVWIA